MSWGCQVLAGPCCYKKQQLVDALRSLLAALWRGKPAQRFINLTLSAARAVAEGPGGKKCYFAGEWKRQRGIQAGFLVLDFSCKLPLVQPASVLSALPPCGQGTLFSLEPLEAPGCARNKTPCPLHDPSTSLHSSDNSLPVLLTLAPFPCSFQRFPCTRQLSLAILLWHPILSRVVCSPPHFMPDLTTAFLGSPQERRIQGGEMPSRHGGGCWGQTYVTPSLAA